VTSLEGAKALVAAGAAKRSDFWLCVGYSGWSPGQLQMELEERDSWYLASTDGSTLLRELLAQAQQLPPPSAGATAADNGISTWASLMRSIGREADVLASEGSLADRMLPEWTRVHLLPKPTVTASVALPAALKVGAVLCTSPTAPSGRPADRFLLRDQFLHKAVMLVLSSADDGDDGVLRASPTGRVRAVVLNRPTANVIRLAVAGKPSRRVAFCGTLALGGQLWLHHREELGGTPLGTSGIFVLPTTEVAAKLQAVVEDADADTDKDKDADADATVTVDDFLLVSAVVEFERTELAGMLAAGQVRVVPPTPQLPSLWPRVWSLTKDDDTDLSDGTEVWWLASQSGADTLAASVPSALADEALDEWIKFFAKGPA